MSDKELIAAARQPTESCREALDKIATEYDMALYTKEETLDRLSRAAVPDAATEVAYADLVAERDDLEERLAGYLCDSTGGLLSKTGYDVRTMVTHTEEYYDKVHAEARKEAEDERDAALAAVERVRAEADAYAEQPDVMEPCGAVAQALRTALDGAPEPEWGREYRRVRPDGVPVFNAVFEALPLLDDYYTAEYRTVSPWLPVEGEKP